LTREIKRNSDEELLVTHPIRGKVSGWFFRLEEVSAGAWQVEGTDRWGRMISIGGSDEQELLTRAEAKAKQINDNLDAT